MAHRQNILGVPIMVVIVQTPTSKNRKPPSTQSIECILKKKKKKKNTLTQKLGSFAATWMDLKIIMLWARSQEKDRYHMRSPICRM